MAMTSDMSRATRRAAEVDLDLQATDPRFRYCVRLTHQDGSILFFDSAFAVKWKDPTPSDWGPGVEWPGVWVLVFTEHHSFFAFPAQDVTVSVFERKKLEWLDVKTPCFECGAPAEWVRHTQFAGDHYFCATDAHYEADFGVGDSYKYWEELKS